MQTIKLKRVHHTHSVMVHGSADKCLVLCSEFDAINRGCHTKLLEHTVTSLQEEVPIHARLLEDEAVLAQLVLLQEVQHRL